MIILLGIAGSGKSSQSKILVEKLNFQWIAVGELLRKKATGLDASAMNHGEMIPDSEVQEIVANEILKYLEQPNEILLDGFPRTKLQSDWLISFSKEHLAITSVVVLELSNEKAKERLMARSRQDDYESAIQKRFDIYNSHIEQILLNFEANKIKVHRIDASNSIEQISKDIITQIKGR